MEKGTPGFTAAKIERKIALRTVQSADVLDYEIAKFFSDAESVCSFEGSREMNNLIVGKSITGL